MDSRNSVIPCIQGYRGGKGGRDLRPISCRHVEAGLWDESLGHGAGGKILPIENERLGIGRNCSGLEGQKEVGEAVEGRDPCHSIGKAIRKIGISPSILLERWATQEDVVCRTCQFDETQGGSS